MLFGTPTTLSLIKRRSDKLAVIIVTISLKFYMSFLSMSFFRAAQPSKKNV